MDEQRQETGAGPRRRHRLAAVLLVLAVCAVGLAATPADAATRPSDPRAQEREFFDLLNTERARAGRGPLAWDANLADDARAWSAVMAPTNSIFHTSTLGADTAASLVSWQRAGENVGMGWSTQSLHDAFVASSGHYANMIGDYNLLGVGVVHTSQRTFVTFRFAKGTPRATAPAPPPPVLSRDDAEAKVRRLYLAYFDREPDTGGLDHWSDALQSGFPLGQVSYEFSRSAEFVTTYGLLDDGGFLRLVYGNVLGRDPDPGGYDYWIRKMVDGMGRGSVMANFAESAEFRAKTA
jgi:uncharacterized protein YkwD